jgi:hypothetical protein
MTTSIFDPISSNITLKLKEKIWNGEFVKINLVLKSKQTLLKGHRLWTHSQTSGLSVLMLMGAVVCCLFVVDWEQLVNVGADRLVNFGAEWLLKLC